MLVISDMSACCSGDVCGVDLSVCMDARSLIALKGFGLIGLLRCCKSLSAVLETQSDCL